MIEIIKKLAKLDLDRKPSSWSGISATVKRADFDRATGGKLGHYEFYQFAGNYPTSDFKTPMPPAFTTTYRGQEYVINTEGYTYARYVARIVD